MLIILKNRDTKIKREIDGTSNLYSRCIDCSFKKHETTVEKEFIYLLESLISS